MSTDLYSQVNFTAGQEVRSQDLSDISNFLTSKLTDQIFGRMLFANVGEEVDYDPHPTGTGISDSATILKYAYVLNPGEAFFTRGAQPNRVYMAPGTIFQKIGSFDGASPKFLPYTFDGTEFLTITNGSGANPRVDIIQMKLELIETDNVSRVFLTEDTFATIVGPTPNFDTTLMARVRGAAGNKIKFALTAGGALALSEVGNECTVTFVTGVTTVSDVETLLQSDSDLVAVQVAGTGANVLSSPGDVLALTALTGGISSVVTSQNLDVKQKVQCTMSMKAGAAAANPAIPDPDAGYVMIAAIYIPGAHAASSTPGDDKYWYINDGGLTFAELTAGDPAAVARCCLMDMRMPVGIRPYTVMPQNFQYAPASGWTLYSNQRQLKQDDATPDGTTTVYVYCPHKVSGRLIAVTVACDPSGGFDPTNAIYLTVDPWYPTVNDVGNLYKLNKLVINAGSFNRVMNTIGDNTGEGFELHHINTDWSTGTIAANSSDQGVPVWTSGLRAPGFNEVAEQSGREFLADPADGFWLVVHFSGTIPQDTRLGPLTFWVAEGI